MLHKSSLILFFLWLSFACDALSTSECLIPSTVVSISMPLCQKIVINRSFANFESFTSLLQVTYGINSIILNKVKNTPSFVSISLSNVTMADMITSVARRFGYNWVYARDKVLFNAFNTLPAESELLPQYRLKISASLPIFVVKSISSHPHAIESANWSLLPQDRTLRSAINRWSKMAGWQLVWNLDADYTITTSWTIYGSFEYAINEILTASTKTDKPILANMYDANHVLEIYEAK